MRKLSRTQLGLLVLAIGLAAFALDRLVIGPLVIGPDVSTAGPNLRGGAGFKGSDEELQAATGRETGFKGSDEELQVTSPNRDGTARAGSSGN